MVHQLVILVWAPFRVTCLSFCNSNKTNKVKEHEKMYMVKKYVLDEHTHICVERGVLTPNGNPH